MAQRVIADATTEQVAAGTIIDTGTARGGAGYAFFASNGGKIIADGAVSLTTGGNAAHVVLVESGSQATLLSGSIVTSTGSGSYGLWATGSDALLTVTGTTFNTSGTGIVSARGGTAIITNSDITSSAGFGLHALDLGTNIIATDVNVATKANNKQAIEANVGTIKLSTDSRDKNRVWTVGNFAYGILAQNSGTVISDGGLQIDTEGNSASGLLAQRKGKISLDAAAGVTTSGTGAYGIQAQDLESAITATDTITTTSGENAHGAVVERAASIVLTRGSITTTGNGADGLKASGNGSSIIATDLVAQTNADDAQGADAKDAANISLSGGQVITQGSQANGLHASDAGTIITTTATIIKTNGTNAQGVYAGNLGEISTTSGSIATTGQGANGLSVYDGGIITANNSIITTSGADAAAIYATQIASGETNKVNISNTVLQSSQSDNIRSEGATLAVSFDSVTAEKGGGVFLNARDDADGNHSIVNLDAKNSVLNGDIFAGTDNIANVNLDASQLTGATNNATNVTLNSESLWNVTDNSTISQILTNGGTIAFTPPIDGNFKTLTAGNYIGTEGMILFNTVLGDDTSATDMLSVDGNTSGDANVKVNNVNGGGAQTVEGIKLIDVAGASEGSFSLLGDTTFNGDQAVVGGAYAYRLYQGSISAPADGNWYLRSQLIDPVAPPVDPVDPPVDPKQPLYQPGVPSYEAYPQILLGLNGLPTLQQRVGNRYWSNAGNIMLAEGADPIGTPYATPYEAGVLIESNGVWGRIEGSQTKINPKYSTSNTDYNYNMFRIQAGLDGMLAENENGKLLGGITVHYVKGNADTFWKDGIDGYGDGKISTDGYGFGGTLTWYGDNGFYLDGQAQLTWYKSNLSANQSHNLISGNNAYGYGLSIEGGKRITVDQSWSVTPQAQLVYSNIGFDKFDDVFGANVSLNKGDSLQGRIGLSVDYQNSWYNDKGTIDRTYVYGIANLYYEFLDGTSIDVSGSDFISRKDRLWGGIGLGGSYNLNNDKYSFFGEGSVNTALQNFDDNYTYKGTVGLRVKW